MKLKNKVVLVTGASLGIGLEVARALGREGCRVVLSARSVERLDAAARSVEGEALAVPLDVTNGASVRSAVEQVERHWGGIDVLVNNAGSGGGMSRWLDSDTPYLQEMFEVHVLGSERMMRAVVPGMRSRAGGTIVNFASSLGYVAMPGTAAYNAAKAAVVMLSKTLRAELKAHGVDVRLFSPPHTKTDSGLEMPLNLPKIFEPAWVAEQFVRFLSGRRPELLAGGNGSLLLLQRLSPALASRIMENIGFGALDRVQQRLQLQNPIQDHESAR